MAKEFFKAHFYPAQFSRKAYVTNSLNYYLASLFFNAFPLPAARSGHPADAALHRRAASTDGYSVLIFPEGRRTDEGAIGRFQPGVGMVAASSRCRSSRSGLRVLTVSCTIHGSSRVEEPPGWPSGVLCGWRETTTPTLARQVEEAVRQLDNR